MAGIGSRSAVLGLGAREGAMMASAVPGRKCSVLLTAPPVKPGGVPDAAAGSACTRNKAQQMNVAHQACRWPSDSATHYDQCLSFHMLSTLQGHA